MDLQYISDWSKMQRLNIVESSVLQIQNPHSKASCVDYDTPLKRVATHKYTEVTFDD